MYNLEKAKERMSTNKKKNFFYIYKTQKNAEEGSLYIYKKKKSCVYKRKIFPSVNSLLLKLKHSTAEIPLENQFLIT